jgi:hypothetical protein
MLVFGKLLELAVARSSVRRCFGKYSCTKERRVDDMLVQTYIATEEVKVKEMRFGDGPVLTLSFQVCPPWSFTMPLWDMPHSRSPSE